FSFSVFPFLSSSLLLSPLCSTLFPYTTLFRSRRPEPGSSLLLPLADSFTGPSYVGIPDPGIRYHHRDRVRARSDPGGSAAHGLGDRKSTRLNSSHVSISYAVFCLKKTKNSNNI